jgi:protein gp37
MATVLHDVLRLQIGALAAVSGFATGTGPGDAWLAGQSSHRSGAAETEPEAKVSESSQIEWTDATWNPITGCSRVSSGCEHCYAERFSMRFHRDPASKFHEVVKSTADGPRWTGLIRLHEKALSEPLHWRKPRRIFVCSMSDLFHPDVPFEFIDQVWAVMSFCPQHTFQVLTKRPERMAEYFGRYAGNPAAIAYRWAEESAAFLADAKNGHALIHDDGAAANVWIGTSIENQAAADERIPHLLRCPAAVRFLSCEPLLGRIDLQLTIGNRQSAINWVIVGGESGAGARPMHPDWVRSIRDQCQAASVPFFFKQFGAWAPTDDDDPRFKGANHIHIRAEDGAMGILNGFHGPQVVDLKARPDQCDSRLPGKHLTPNGNIVCMSRLGKKTAGRVLDGRTWEEFPASRRQAGVEQVSIES